MAKPKDAVKKDYPAPRNSFKLEYANAGQKMAWSVIDQHDISFVIGAAGTGKSHIAIAYAISELLAKRKRKIILTRPIVESGEKLGFLPGMFDEKVAPYMTPLYDCISRCVGTQGPHFETVQKSLEVAPLAYLRGRSQPLDSMVMTPDGPVKMGDVTVGSKVIGSNGKEISVLGVYPQGKLEIFNVTFSDGTITQCSGDHLWFTQTLNEKRHGKLGSIKTTNEIFNKHVTKWGQKIHRIPVLSQPVDFKAKNVTVDPYLLGVLLGDGCLHNKAGVLFSTADAEIVEAVSKVLPHNLKVVYKGKYDYKISGKRNERNVLKQYLSELGLMGRKSYDKFIPLPYLYNQTAVRIALLQGLMDTDGWVGFHPNTKNARLQYYTTSPDLARDFVFLVQSLGGVAYKWARDFDESDTHIHNGHAIRHTCTSYVIDFSLPAGLMPARLTRKISGFSNCVTPGRLIAKVEPAGIAECQCIQVDSADHLYATDGFVLTHNTFHDAVCIFDEAQNATYDQFKLFLTRLGKNSKMIITGDPTQTDIRGNTALNDVVNKVQCIEGVGLVELKLNSIVRHPLVGKIIEKLN